MSVGDCELQTIIKDLIQKTSNNELSSRDIDFQFSAVLDKISILFQEALLTKNFSILFDYISQSIIFESELRVKYNFEKLRQYSSTNIYSLGLLITKINLIHTKIISQLIDEIFLLYSDYIELCRIGDFDIAIELKLAAVELSNIFILYLTENRSINEKMFEKYIKLISQGLKIFN